MFQKRTAGAYGPLRKETPGKIEINGWTSIYTSLESYSSRLTSKDELKNLFSSLLLGLMYVVLIRLVIYVNKLFVHSKFVYMFLLLLTFAIPPTRTPRVKLCEACQKVPSHLSSPHHSSGTELLLTCIQLFRERLSDEVHATNPKGIVGGFEFTVLRRNLNKWHKRP